MLGDGDRLYAVALAAVEGRLQGVVEVHIGVKRVILRADGLLGVGIVEWRRHLRLVGEELAQLDVGGDAVRFLCFGAALHHGLLQPAKAVGDVASRHVQASQVAQLHVHGSAGRPSTFVVGLAQAQFVDPHFAALQCRAEVAHAHHHRLHFAQRGVSDDADAVVGLVGVVVAEELCVAGGALGASFVAGLLQCGEHGEVHVEHVLLGPHDGAVAGHVPVVASLGGELQRDEVFVVVALVVAS